jgi:Xaa-Pro aminopeptidase
VKDLNELLGIVERSKGTALGLGSRPAPALEFPLAEYGSRYSAAVAMLGELELDALVLAQSTSVRYFTGMQTWLSILPPLIPSVAILPLDPARATLVTTVLERGGVDATSWLPEPTFYGLADDPIEAVVGALRQRGLDRGRLGFELGLGQKPHLSPADLQRLISSLPSATIVDVAMPLWAIRALKSDGEVAYLREATRLSQVGYQAAFDALAPGVTEAALTRVAAQAMLAAGANPSVTPMTLIFLAGPERYRQVLQPSIERAIKPGEQLWLDGGCSVHGYRADFIRSGVIGRLADSAEHWYDVSVAALDEAVQALGPGRQLGESWAAAQETFEAAGAGENTLIPDQIGHSVGLDHWELPLIGRPGTEQGEVIARPGMVLCVEPTIVGMDGDGDWTGGIFCAEDQVVVTGSGVEILTADIPRTLIRR